jgi:hypothetical protein
MTSKQIAFKKATEAVAGVGAAFGGLLLNIQPPDGIASGFAVGFASALSVLIFLAISVIADLVTNKRKYRIIFLIISLPLILGTVLSGLSYEGIYSRNTVSFPDAHGRKIIISQTMTPLATEQLAKNPRTPAQLLLDAGGIDAREKIWQRDSLVNTTINLNNAYILFSVLLSAAVFSVLEGFAPSKRDNP